MITTPENNQPPASAEVPLTPGYIAAIDAHNVAMRAYRSAVEAYRAGTLGEGDYLRARTARDAAHAAFDAAYDLELKRAAP